MINLFKPYMIDKKYYLQYLTKMHKNLWFANFGPLYNQFKNKLAHFFNVDSDYIELFSSGTSALVSAIKAISAPKKKYCLVPSWTFVATVQAIKEAGLVPYYLDVDLKTMQPSQDQLNQVPKRVLNETAILLLVAPFGKPIRDTGPRQFSKKYSIPILVDAAAGFDNAFNKRLSIVISMHATKVFAIGEGGLLYSPSKKIIQSARAYSNFGFINKRDSIQAGLNHKLSEIHSAIGIPTLKFWNKTKIKYLQLAHKFLSSLDNPNIHFMQGWGVDYVSSTCVIHCKDKKIKQLLIKEFDKNNIEWRDWWNQGCHANEYLRQFASYSLPQTDMLAQTTIGIPFHLHLKPDEIKKVFQVINSIN
ncbi:hypothetical protein VI34_06425 [Methylophilales bacterium MBRSG12]|nr:hypothetical protein UZ34_03900 [Methylophilales bacterium MBRSF5]AKO67613.1 hypothetical protein VI34_06425 [Methylophilales bacterium MBRSG12]